MNLQLEDKLALVTGSTAGIGLAIATALAAEGAAVIVNGRSEERVAAAIAHIRRKHPGARLESLPADLSTPEAADRAIAVFPHVHILVNNLGRYAIRPFEEITDQEWIDLIEANFMSGVRLSRHYCRR